MKALTTKKALCADFYPYEKIKGGVSQSGLARNPPFSYAESVRMTIVDFLSALCYTYVNNKFRGKIMKQKGTKNITWTQRLQLEAYLNSGLHKKEIAEKLGLCLSSIYNELKRGAYEHKYKRTDWFGDPVYKTKTQYSSTIAEEKYRINMTAHGAPIKLGNDYDFVRYVEKRVIEDKLSPCAVLGEIKRNKMFRTDISKTTLYRYIETGIFLNLTVSDLPMSQKKKKYRKILAKKAPKGTSIEKRPGEISTRKTFGHWEMDCVVGSRETGPVLLVLTERMTRYELIIKMTDRKAFSVVKTLNKLERRYGKRFRQVFKSITVDNGSEFSDFKGLEKSIYNGNRTRIYYCHPYTSCERGSNERINRDIRRLIPKGSNLSSYSDELIQYVENWVNAYPREMFGYATSAEMFSEQLKIL